MDPNFCLACIRSLSARMISFDINIHGDAEEFEEKAIKLAEHIRDLDEWITNGGFLPKAWIK